MKALRAACAAAIFLGVSVSAPLAWADTSTAETLFQEGLAAMKRSDFTIACEAFDKSNKQDPSPGTQINLAICYEKQKKWASAWTWYRSAAGLAQQRNQPQREQNATESAKRLEPQLHHVMISIKNGTPDAVVKRDGNEITVSLGGRDVALPFDPGDHVIEIKATGKKTLTKSIVTPDVPAASDKAEVLPFTLEDAPVDPNAGLETGGPSAPKTTVIRTESDGSAQRTVGLIVGGAGILTGLAAGGVFVLANKEASQRDDQQAVFNDTSKSEAERNGAAKSANSHNDAANNDQLIALILTGGAVVMVGLGAVLFFTAPKSKEKTATIVPTPIAGPNFQGLGVVGTF